MPIALRLNGALDLDALRAALADVAARHESLRTIFPDGTGSARQLVLDPADARPRLDVTETGEDALRAALAAAAGQGFDLSVEPPLRARLFALGAARTSSCSSCTTSRRTAGRWRRSPAT